MDTLKHYDIPNSTESHLAKIISEINLKYSDHKYTVYRCALKITSLQSVFYTSSIPYKLVLSVLEQHGLARRPGDAQLSFGQLNSILRETFSASEKLGYLANFPSYQLDSCVDLLMHFFWSTFECHLKPLFLVELKESLLILTKVNSVEHMISELFSLFQDHNRCIVRTQFQLLLKILVKILSQIGESDSYGEHNIQTIMDQCFSKFQGIDGINEYQFNCLWTTTQTRFLIYTNLLSLVKRIRDTEKLVHYNRCSSCAADKIIGIRFKCKKCKCISLCMMCFVKGFTSNKHNNSHQMYEVFTEDVQTKSITYYLANICNFFNIRDKLEETSSICNSTTCKDQETNESDTAFAATVETRLSDSTTIVKESKSDPISTQIELPNMSTNFAESLQTITNKLLEENRKINTLLKTDRTTAEYKDFLMGHQKSLYNIIVQLKQIGLTTGKSSYPASSTPNRTSFVTRISNDSFSDHLTNSINGASINQNYVDANKSDYSLSDLSSWFRQKVATTKKSHNLAVVDETEERRDPGSVELCYFRDLTSKIKDIIEDSYSDNSELAAATCSLESAVDSIIREEEVRRQNAIV